MKKDDPDGLNAQRAEWAAQVLNQFQQMTGAGSSDESLRDLISDLRHWADRTGIDWDNMQKIAMRNYWAEVNERTGNH